MAVKLPFFHDLPAHSYTVPLSGVQYEIRLVYRARTASWYLDLRNEEGVPLVLGRRLSPPWSPVTGVITDGPPGVILALGADPYDRFELELWYFDESEFQPEGEDLLPVELE